MTAYRDHLPRFLTTRAACYRAAHLVARAVGFSNVTTLRAHVIGRGWRAGDCIARHHTLTAAHWAAQCLTWAGEDSDRASRARWVRAAFVHAFPMVRS